MVYSGIQAAKILHKVVNVKWEPLNQMIMDCSIHKIKSFSILLNEPFL